MHDNRFWGPRGPYGPPLREDWYYRCSDIPCHAHVPWEGCPYPPDVCHDPKYHYPPPLPVMGPVPPKPSKCDCEKTEEEKPNNTDDNYTDKTDDKDTTYTLSRDGNNIILTGSDGNVYTVQDRDTVFVLEDGVVTESKLSKDLKDKLNNATWTLEDNSVTEAKLAEAVRAKLNATGSGSSTPANGSITEEMLTDSLKNKLNATGTGVTYTLERDSSDSYVKLKGSDGSESGWRDVILSTWIGQKQIFWVHLSDSLKSYIMGQGVYTYVDGQTFDTNNTPLIAINKANERKNIKVYTPGAYDSSQGINFYECLVGAEGWSVDEEEFDNRPIVETKSVNGKRFFKIRLYAGYTDKDNSAGVANVLLNLAWLPEGSENLKTRTAGDENYTFTYHNTGITQQNKGLFSVKAIVKKEYMKMNNKDVNVIDIEFCEDDVTPVVWHENIYNDGELTTIPENAFTSNGTTFIGVNFDLVATSVYRQNLTIVSVIVEKVSGD